MTDVAAGAIQKSFAIEFDTFLNKEYTGSNPISFDAKNFQPPAAIGDSGDFKNPHISYQYPGLASSYSSALIQVPPNSILSTSYKVNELNHTTFANNPYLLANDGETEVKNGWKHFDFKYIPPVKDSTMATMQITFNDKYPDGTPKPKNLYDSKNRELDISNFGSPDGKIYWGFTAANGSTGTAKKDMALIIEKLPAVADINSATSMEDLTTGISSTDTENGQPKYTALPTSAGDKLNFIYDLKYVDGISETGDITATIAMPGSELLDSNNKVMDKQMVDYGSDSTVPLKVTYTDENGVKQEQQLTGTIEETDLTLPPATALGKPISVSGKAIVNVKLPNLIKKGQQIRIELQGTAQAPPSDKEETIAVRELHTSYLSDNYSGDVMSPKFTVNNNPLVISSDNLTPKFEDGDTLNLTGAVNYLKSTEFGDKTLSAEIKGFDSNGKELEDTVKADIPVAKTDTTKDFKLEYPAENLKAGETYTFEMKFTDSAGNVSNTLVYTIKVEDGKQLVLRKTNAQAPFSIEPIDQIDLTFDIEYNRSGTNVIADQVKTYLQIDDGKVQELALDATDGISISTERRLDAAGLEKGDHTAKIYATDTKKQSQNVLEYQFTVIDRGLILTPDRRVINVTDNAPVDIKWTIKGIDDLFVGTGEFDVNSLFIKNEDDKDFRELELLDNQTNGKAITHFQSGVVQMINPISASGNINYKLNQLKEGKNEIKFSVTNRNIQKNPVDKPLYYTSAEETVVINVPKMKLQLNSNQTNYNIKKSSTVTTLDASYDYTDMNGNIIDYSANVGYSGLIRLNYFYGQVGKGNDAVFSVVKNLDDKQIPNLRVILSTILTKPIVSPVPMRSYLVDPYGRQSDDVNYTVTILDKYLALHLGEQTSSFRDISFKDKDASLITRNANWDVSVESMGTKWGLFAKSDGLVGPGNHKKNLTFVDEQNVRQPLSDAPMIYRGDSTSINQSTLTSISDTWTDQTGILLVNNKPDLSGDYKGTIEWEVTDAVE